jgi:putative glutamine amidotransferase
MTPRPLIGVPGMWSEGIKGLRFAGVAVAVEVLRSIDRAGGEPVVLFPASSEGAAAQVGRVDAVVLPGGSDVDPALYGQKPHAEYGPTDYEGQDAFELGIIDACVAQGVPLLAICRGMQLLNVGRGGSLVQHLEPGDVQHRGEVHEVRIEPGSLLADAVGGLGADASSYHHQAVGTLGASLRVTARAADGVVEALELPGAEVLAVQWHPEDLAASSASDHALFEWVVERARVRGGHLAEASA